LRLYVSNIDYDVSTAELRQLFEKYGKVLDCYIVHDKATGRSRGFGFVTFENEGDGHDAITKLDGTLFEDRFLNVKEAHPRASEGRRE